MPGNPIRGALSRVGPCSRSFLTHVLPFATILGGQMQPVPLRLSLAGARHSTASTHRDPLRTVPAAQPVVCFTHSLPSSFVPDGHTHEPGVAPWIIGGAQSTATPHWLPMSRVPFGHTHEPATGPDTIVAGQAQTPASFISCGGVQVCGPPLQV